MTITAYDVWGGLLLAPVLVILALPALRRQARREHDRRVFGLLLAALILKLAAGGGGRWAMTAIYDKGDALAYHAGGIQVADRSASGGLDLGLQASTPENFIDLITGLVYSVTRPTLLGGFLVFAWLGFWGLFWFYRAFQLAVPNGRLRTYARFVFFWPSVVFWPSSIGKEAWMMFTLGLASFGIASLLSGGRSKGILFGSLGLLGAAVVRPHFAGFMAIALAIAYIIKRPSPSLRQLAPVAKALSLIVVVLAAGLILRYTERFLENSGLPIEGGLTSVGTVANALDEASANTQQGGSEFEATDLGSPAGIAMTFGTVLFRPLPTEAGNAQALLAAAESSALLLIVVVRFRWVTSAVRSMRQQPYIAFLAAYAVGGILALSSVANFGILARQRSLIMPAVFVLLSVPPRESEIQERSVRAGDDGG